ncbi:MAG: hypothetical protein ACLFUE_06860 [Desulfobacteraceae bacterium]
MDKLRGLILWSVIGAGLSTVPAQLLVVREFLDQFHGNEITISLVLCCWLLLTGAGSLAAKPVKRPGVGLYAFLCLILAVWPLAQLVGIRLARDLAFAHGAAPGFYGILLFVVGTTAPYCLLAGFILPCALSAVRARGFSLSSGGLYITDSIGDIAGGAAFSFLLVYWLRPFEAVVATSVVLAAAALVLLAAARKIFLVGAGAVLGAALVFLGTDQGFELNTLEWRYGEIVRYEESPYGRVVVTQEGSQYTFWESGVPLTTGDETADLEERIHYPLSQLDRVESVLLVSGGIGGALGEVEKYRPREIDYVELDPAVTRAAAELGLLGQVPGLSIKNIDGRRYVRGTDKTYDAVIMDLPDPDTFQANRFFTSRFFSMVRERLRPGGVFSFGLDYYPNYLSEEMRCKISSIYNTAALHFDNVLMLPGEKVYFLCRSGPLSSSIPERLEDLGISTTYIKGYYHGNVSPERIKMLRDALDPDEAVNTDFQPRVMSLVFQEWFKKHHTSPVPFLAVLGVLTCLYMVFMKREEYTLFTTGLATMGIEMVVVFTFQVLHGYVYLEIGAIVTAFLAGLLPGAAAGKLWQSAGARNKVLFADAALILGAGAYYVWLHYGVVDLHPRWFLVYGFCFSFFCGFQFPAAAELIGEEKSPAAGCLAADLAGAAIGTLAVGALLIPLMGIKAAAGALILVKASSSALILIGGRGRIRFSGSG